MNNFISKLWLIPFAIVATVIVLQFIDAWRKSRRQYAFATASSAAGRVTRFYDWRAHHAAAE